MRRWLLPLVSALGLVMVLAPTTSARAATTGQLTLSPGGAASATIATSLTNGTAAATFTVPASTARPFYASVQFRSISVGEGYRTKAAVLANGTLTVSVSRVQSGKETLLRSVGVAGSVASGQRIHVQGSIAGTTGVDLAVRAWVDGATQPGWQLNVSDSSSSKITSGGPVRIWSYLSPKASASAAVAFADASATATSTPAAPAASSGKPSAATTGVPAGTKLTVHQGNITVTQSGTHLDGLDIHGFVVVRATNVTISNSIVRGGVATFDQGLITNYGYANLVIDRVDFINAHPSVWVDGIKGDNFTAKGVHVVGNVDSVKIQGDNVSIQNSLLENTTFYASDPNQGGGSTHNDNVQILNGQNIKIVGNTIRGATGFAILGSATHGNTNLVLQNNWLDGGHCTVKLSLLNGWSETATVTGNKFGPNRAVKSCPFQAEPAVHLTASANVYEVGGATVPILRVNS